jgi:dTMP kinase
MFIVFDGMDGCGKTTAAKWFKGYLNSLGKSVLLTREPSDGPIGDHIREMIREGIDLDNETWYHLFYADRLDHIEKMKAVMIGDMHMDVVCDRYVDSTWVYQGFYHNDSISLMPKHTFILDVPVEVARERLHSRNKPLDSFDKLDQQRIKEKFLRAFEREKESGRNMWLINSDQPAEALHKEITDIVEKHFTW